MKRIIVTFALLTTLGCSSFRTQSIDRCENDTLIVNPEQPLKGIPVAVRVPTHLEMTVMETTYWEKEDVPAGKPTLKLVSTCRPTRTIDYSIKETEKIFLVDPVRPGSGTANYGFTFQSNTQGNGDAAGKGYLQKVNLKIEDNTIKDSATLLASSLGLIQAIQTSANSNLATTSNLIATKCAVAFARFDINSQTYECDVAAFLDANLNCNNHPRNSPPNVCNPGCE